MKLVKGVLSKPTGTYSTQTTTYTTNALGVSMPAGAYEVVIECYGGGASGMPVRLVVDYNPGGGGGAYAKKTQSGLTGTPKWNFYVGAAVNSTSTASVAGNPSYTEYASNGVDYVEIARAVGGGAATGTVGGTGGQASASTGDVKYSGGNGGAPIQPDDEYSGPGGGCAGNGGNGSAGNPTTGVGGSAGTDSNSIAGSGGAGRLFDAQSNGVAGNTAGAGGSGGVTTSSSQSSTGGQGARGAIKVTWYIFEL